MVTIQQNTVNLEDEVQTKVDAVLAQFNEARKHPDTEWETHSRVIFATSVRREPEYVVQAIARAFKSAGYYVWVERGLGRYNENGALAVTVRPVCPNYGNNFCQL